jgi:fructokinase
VTEPVIAVLGEAVVDLVDQGGGLYRAHPGGSPLNVAVGLGRLGRATELHARVSADAFGQLFRRHLAASGVGVHALVDAAEPSTLAVASLDPAGVASYDFWVQGTADWQWTAAELAVPLGDHVVALHTGSMTLEVEPGASLVLDLLRRHRGRVTISYDPNVRLARRDPTGSARDRARSAAALADLVKVSVDDLAWLRPGEDPPDVADAWVAAARSAGSGPALVVVTQGAAGAFAVTARGVRQRRPARPVVVADTVGAGDAFMAGLLDGLAATGVLGPGRWDALAGLGTADLADLLEHAMLVAALTCARAGADPPTRAEVLAAQGPDLAAQGPDLAAPGSRPA